MTHPPSNTASSTSRTVARGVITWRLVLHRVRRALERAHQSVNPQGWLVLWIAVVGTVAGFVFGWLEAVVAGLIGITLIILAIPFLTGNRTYRVGVTLDDDRIVVGEEAGGTITVTNTGKRPAFPGVVDLPIEDGSLELRVPLLRGGQEMDRQVTIPGRKRGLLQVGPPRTVRRDPLGLFFRERTWQDAQRVYVHPRTVTLPSMSSGLIRDLEGQASRTVVPDDLSFHAIREYQSGDSRRHIHWKSTAKMGTLMVRQYEETRRSDVLIVLAAKAEEFRDEPEFELAVSVATSLGVRGIIDGRKVRVSTPADTGEHAHPRSGQVRDIRATTPRIMLDQATLLETGEHALRLPETARVVAQNPGSASIVFLVCGSGVTAKDVRRAALAFPQHVQVVAIVCDTHAEPSIHRFGDLPVLSVGILDDAKHLLARSAYA